MNRKEIKTSFDTIKGGRRQIKDKRSWDKIEKLFSRTATSSQERFDADEVLYLKPKKTLIHCDKCGKVIKLGVFELMEKFGSEEPILCDKCLKEKEEQEQIQWDDNKLIQYNKKFRIIKVNPKAFRKPKYIITLALVTASLLILLLYSLPYSKQEVETRENTITEATVEDILIEGKALSSNLTGKDVIELFKDSVTFDEGTVSPEKVYSGEVAYIRNDGTKDGRGCQIQVVNNTDKVLTNYDDITSLPVKEFLIYSPNSITINGVDITSENIGDYLDEVSGVYMYTDKDNNVIQIDVNDQKIVSCIVKINNRVE